MKLSLVQFCSGHLHRQRNIFFTFVNVYLVFPLYFFLKKKIISSKCKHHILNSKAGFLFSISSSVFSSVDVNSKVGERSERSNILFLKEKQDISHHTEQNLLHMKTMSTNKIFCKCSTMSNSNKKFWLIKCWSTSIEKEFDFLERMTTSFLQKSA